MASSSRCLSSSGAWSSSDHHQVEVGAPDHPPGAALRPGRIVTHLVHDVAGEQDAEALLRPFRLAVVLEHAGADLRDQPPRQLQLGCADLLDPSSKLPPLRLERRRIGGKPHYRVGQEFPQDRGRESRVAFDLLVQSQVAPAHSRYRQTLRTHAGLPLAEAVVPQSLAQFGPGLRTPLLRAAGRSCLPQVAPSRSPS